MEQRLYRGNLTPEALADYLVQYYDPQEDLQAQKIGQGETVLVQIGRGDRLEDVKGAITVGVARAPDGDGIVVTMGQQQWLRMEHGGWLLGSLIGAIFTPWALFGLIWPLSSIASSLALPREVWSTIEHYCISAGGTLGGIQQMGGVPCANCGMMNIAGATTCAMCGQALAAPAPATAAPAAQAVGQPADTAATGPTVSLSSRTCPNCGSATAPNARFCHHCGSSLG